MPQLLAEMKVLAVCASVAACCSDCVLGADGEQAKAVARIERLGGKVTAVILDGA